MKLKALSYVNVGAALVNHYCSQMLLGNIQHVHKPSALTVTVESEEPCMVDKRTCCI